MASYHRPKEGGLTGGRRSSGGGQRARGLEAVAVSGHDGSVPMARGERLRSAGEKRALVNADRAAVDELRGRAGNGNFLPMLGAGGGELDGLLN
ncbi:hypothetical protein BRADI_3g10295v3 [Brachypodium distachyon]|uniref:Uncharacterized protein n=1 Tax=Brachypodium distachyon TaxID=15368 RepID=A0A2K2CWC6_BRADI|nr:hypothetical protein BRADI_3g10295v3 [Brachypodium distachyon]